MNALNIIVLPYPEDQPYDAAVQLIIPLVEFVEKRLDFGKKTNLLCIRMRTTLDITRHFLKEGNLKAAQLTLMRHGEGLADDLKKIFYNNKKQKSEACKLMVKFLDEMMRISQ